MLVDALMLVGSHPHCPIIPSWDVPPLVAIRTAIVSRAMDRQPISVSNTRYSGILRGEDTELRLPYGITTECND